MSLEGQSLDYKSLLAVIGKTADWGELAKDCVAFANAQGGRLLIGIEDDETEPPATQIIPAGLTRVCCPWVLRRAIFFINPCAATVSSRESFMTWA